MTQIEHVIWSAENNALYEKNECSGRLSVTTPFGMPHVGSNYVAHVYKFTCIGMIQNSNFMTIY